MLQVETVLVKPGRDVLDRGGFVESVARQLGRPARCPAVRPPGRLDRIEQQNEAGAGADDGDGCERYSSASSVALTLAIVATVSPSSSRMMITPCV